MQANQIDARRGAGKPTLARTQPEPEHKKQNAEAKRHPRRMNVGKPPCQRVMGCRVQLIDLVDRVVGQASEQRFQCAIEVARVSRLEGEQYAKVGFVDARVGTQHQLFEFDQ